MWPRACDSVKQLLQIRTSAHYLGGEFIFTSAIRPGRHGTAVAPHLQDAKECKAQHRANNFNQGEIEHGFRQTVAPDCS
jgi:hypothetical protein